MNFDKKQNLPTIPLDVGQFLMSVFRYWAPDEHCPRWKCVVGMSTGLSLAAMEREGFSHQRRYLSGALAHQQMSVLSTWKVLLAVWPSILTTMWLCGSCYSTNQYFLLG